MRITAEEKRRLEKTGFSISYLPDTGTPQGLYHDPRTGQEFQLPATPTHTSMYQARGLKLGAAPPKMRKQWEKLQAQRTEGPEAAFRRESAEMLRQLTPEAEERLSKIEEKLEQLTELLLSKRAEQE